MAEQSNPAGASLIAAWPGMGNVAIIAAGYLVQKLAMREAGELAPGAHFDINEVTISAGLINTARLPRGGFFRWTNPGAGRDLFVFLAEAQPTASVYAYANSLLDAAAAMGVTRVITFASMASSMHPSADPKVACVATDPATLEELRRAEVRPMQEGQISGLNGVLLAAAAERGMSGVCLLAEIPYFAAAAPNPKAARAALSVFSVLAGIDISLDELSQHGAAVERMLVEAYDRLQAAGAFEDESEDSEDDESESTAEGAADKRPSPDEADASATPRPTPRAPDAATRERIERLFEDAKKDQSRATPLKQELDRLGVFKEYENRFLDLFRRAG